MEELRLLNQDATVYLMSRMAQILHFSGELRSDLQLDIVKLLFKRRDVRHIRAAFACGRTCFITYEGATRLALLSILHSPRGPRIPGVETQRRIGALIPVVHNRTFTHPILEDERRIHSIEFRREMLLQFFLMGTATAAGSPLPTLGGDLKLGALVAAAAQVKSLIDRDLSKALNVSLRELAAVAQLIAAQFAPFPKEGEASPHDYKDAQLLNATGGLPQLIQDVMVALAVKRPENMSNALAVLRSPRTAWPAEVSWRPFYVTGEGESRAAVCWDIRSLHNMLSWGFAEFARPFVPSSTFGAIDETWNAALEQVIQSAVSSTLPTFQRPSSLGQVDGLPSKNADWIALSGDNGLVVEFKNGVARPATFRNPSPDYFEKWLRDRYIKPDGLRQVYITILRAATAGKATLARQVMDSPRLWPIVVTPTSLIQSPTLFDFVESEAQTLRSELPELPPNVQPPTLLDIGELLALTSLPLGTQGDVLEEFRRVTRESVRIWTFDRFLYEKFGQIPKNAWLDAEGEKAQEAMLSVMSGLYQRLGVGAPAATS